MITKKTILLGAFILSIFSAKSEIVEITFEGIQTGDLSFTNNGIIVEEAPYVNQSPSGLWVNDKGALAVQSQRRYRFSSTNGQPFKLLGLVFIEGGGNVGVEGLLNQFAYGPPVRYGFLRPDPYEVANFYEVGVPERVESQFSNTTFFYWRSWSVIPAAIHSIIIEIEDDEDTTPPIVDATVALDSFGGPNHKLVDVGLSALVEDDQDPDPIVEVFVYSDEATDAKGSGNSELDAIDDGEILSLRSERSGKGDGRVYLIVVTATDASGNVGWDCATVTVPKSNSKKSVQSAEAQALAAESTFLLDGEIPADFFLLTP